MTNPRPQYARTDLSYVLPFLVLALFLFFHLLAVADRRNDQLTRSMERIHEHASEVHTGMPDLKTNQGEFLHELKGRREEHR